MQWDKEFPSTLFYYDTKKWVMWLGRDERVDPEVTVRNFGAARSERAFRKTRKLLTYEEIGVEEMCNKQKLVIVLYK